MKKSKLLTACLGIIAFLMLSLTGIAQQIKVSGVIQEAKNSTPLQGASVSVKNGKANAITNQDGKFEITVPNGNGALVVSFVGFQTQDIPVNGRTEINITLQPATTGLDEVVVIGYGTQKRATVSGAIADVKLDKLSSRSLGNVSEALQGKVPGVIVTNEGGDPTSSPRVNIRGLGGINGENPLYVVDGSIYSGGPINPNEIESISVLKDAAASIYGARASGGVIIITTKKGKTGDATITLDAKYGQQSVWKKLQPLNAKEYADVMNLAADNAGKPRLDAFDAAKNPDGQVTRTNWMDDIFRTGTINDYNAGITGGNEKSNYYLSFGYRDNEGILLNTNSKRYDFRINSNHQLKPWLKFGENLQFTSTNGNGANTTSAYTGAILTAIFYPPSVSVYNADGSFSGLPAQFAGAYGDVINPVAYLKRLDSKSPNNNLFINPYVEIKLMKDLSFRSNLAITKAFSANKSFDSRVLEIGKIFDFNRLSQSSDNFTELLAEQTLTYNKQLGEHHLNVLGGYSFQQSEWDGFSVFAQNFDNEAEANRYFQNAHDIYQPYSYKSKNVLISYLGRINYDYKSKYLLTLIGRRDGTSLVAKQNRFANYGSVSGGWLISRENFLKDVSWLSNLKLRSSYGILGNLGSLPVNAVNVPLVSTSVYMGQDPTLIYGYAENALSNPNIKWAKSYQTNFGLDLGLFKNRISLVADYFVKSTRDMLLQLPPTSTNGVEGGKWENVGEARDKGIELGLNYNSNSQSEFQYSIGATLTKVTNKLISLKEGINVIPTSGINIRSTLTPLIIRTGQPLYSYNVIQTAGLFKSQQEIDNYKGKNGNLIQPNAKPGDLKFVDANGDGVISNDDRVIVGSAYPGLTYGFSFNASYKNFDLNLFAQGVHGNKLFNGLKYLGLQASVSGQNYNMLKGILNAWSPTNVNSSIPRVSWSDPNGNFSNTSDWFIEDGSYLRIKNITLGYTLPQSGIKKVGINSIRVYVTGNNLLTFTKYSGFDPEVGMNNYGIDIGLYPQARSVFFGASVNF